MPDSTERLSRSVEDFLKAIYGISEQGGTASTSALAEALDIQPASVTGMAKRLAESGLVEHVPYRGVRLTPEGARQALKVLRRHRILESYLCDRLGYSWDDVHDEAERLEHAVSDHLIERMAAALEFPNYDPHGTPIPTPGGEIEATDFSTLADAAPGAEVRVRAVQDEDPTWLRSMEERGLTPGTRLTVGRTEADESLTVLVEDDVGPTEVGRDMARRIYVVPDSD